MRFPTTVFEFMETFPDEEACWRYLRRARWLPLSALRPPAQLPDRGTLECTAARAGSAWIRAIC